MNEPFFEDSRFTLYNKSCAKLLEIPDNAIDLVFTDPPYLREFLYTYDYLANVCPQKMKRGASLVTIIGHFAIPEVLEKFKGKLKYRWMLCMNQFDGAHARMAMGIEVTWKPMLWFVKEAYPQGRGFLRDGVKITGNEGQVKKDHKWQQDLSWASYYIEKLTQPNDIVLDPFIGSGTTAIACNKLGRFCVGYEIDEHICEDAVRRYKVETTNNL